LIGQAVSHYRITALLGAGGMGEVYRATDASLGREVAIKVLPAQVSSDPERLARFRREAHLLASLNHPNVAAIYGFEEADGRPFLVLELVEGPTLADRIAKGAIPMEEALEIARQIAEALEEAHEKGIVHRDLKPANVKLTAEGKVKVLDFGLAKAWAGDAAAASQPDLSRSPTLTSPGSLAGVILGTAAYMSPEQARGQPVDKRTDVWAFGVVLYEMLTGRNLFVGPTVSDTLAAVLRADPDWTALPPQTPTAVRRLLARCLTRDPRARLHDVADARLEIVEAQADGPGSPVDAARAPRTRRALAPWVLAAALAAATAVLGVIAARHVAEQPRVVRFELWPPEGTVFHLHPETPGAVVVSPDGGSLAFCAAKEGVVRLYVRALEATEARALPGTEGAQYPFWSPDSRFLGFFVDGKLKKVGMAGGPSLTLCDAPEMKGASWGRGGVIVFAPSATSPLHRVSDAGGVSSVITRLDPARHDDSHRHPRFLPDGRHFIYLARTPGGGDRGDNAIVLASLDGGPEKVLLRSGAAAEYAAGHLLYLRNGSLMAQPFDAGRLELTGEAFPVQEDVRRLDVGTAVGVFSVSDRVLAYEAGGGPSARRLVWRDRAGKEIGTIGETAGYQYQVRLSPRGDFAAVPIRDPSRGTEDLWIYELARGVRTRFTFDAAAETWPAWSPDGQTLIYASTRKGPSDLYRKPLVGAVEEDLLLESNVEKLPESVSPDGRLLVYSQLSEKTYWDVWALPLQGARTPFPLIRTPFLECCAKISPDGRWLAYMSQESGRFEIYLTTFPTPGPRWQVSTSGGAYPCWRSDRKEVVYSTLDGTVMAAEVAARGDGLAVGAAKPLFKTTAPGPTVYVYSPTPDLRRFLIVEPLAQEEPRPLTVVVNWTAPLATAAPGRNR
jgi:Tol biopolymer transport system component